MTTQKDITKWEMENFDEIIKWEIIYSSAFDTIIFYLNDKTEKQFLRIPKFPNS